jgi:amino acid transporter
VSDVTAATQHDDDAQLDRYGYRQQFVRSLRNFESFAVAFSFISITTGIFTTYGFALATGGPRSIWTWLIVVTGQALVALVYGALAARVPLSGYSYQWASRLANVHVGWWLGWMSFAFLTIVTVSVDYGLVQVAFQPLIGETYTPTSAALETLVVLALQAVLIIISTRATTRVNNTAVATEVIGIVGLTVLLIIVAAIRSKGHWANLTSTGVVPQAGYYAWLGPFMLATLLGAYTIVGFESASNLAEETIEPHRTIPPGDDPRRAGVRCGRLRLPHRAQLLDQQHQGRVGQRRPGRVHRPGRARRRRAEAVPDLRGHLHLRLRPDHHGDQTAG